MNSLFSLTDRVAIVTGGGRGIGKGIALGLAEAGADVIVTARTVAEIERTAAEIRSLGRRALAIPADVRVSEQVADVVQRTLDEFHRIDVLVNNAGATFVLPALKLSERGWDGLIVENLKSCFLCSKAVVEAMIKQGKGSIINIASTEGLRAGPTNPAYGAAKAGLINLTQSLALEWAPHHIRVNAIAPGFIQTEALPLALQEYPHLQELLNRVPLGHPGTPKDIAAAVIYLASDASGYVTGAVITVDGGQTCLLG